MTGARITAIHEAGHAIVGRQFGFDVRRVVLHSPDSGSVLAGRCEIVDMRRELDADPVRCLIYILSGPAAEKKLTGRPSSSNQRDRAQARVLAAAVCEVADESHPRVRALVNSAEVLAVALMYDPVVWTAIERVAAALERKRELSGRDVALVLREACKR